MIKKRLMFFILPAFLILICGCETIKGAFKGGAEGVKKDLGAIKKANDWVRRTLW